jgi:hypothetical protein
MQTKSEMINRIAELAKENAELKEEVKQLHNGRNPEELYTLFGKPIKYWEELKAENDRLKEKIKTIKTFRKIWEAEAQKQCCIKVVEVDKYKQILQEIKTIAEENKDTAQYGGICKSILMIITKAEEE